MNTTPSGADALRRVHHRQEESMSAYTPPDKIEIYAAALQSDINSERFQVVESGKLKTYWIGTVYGGGVATARGYKFDTPEEAWENASAFVERCAEILSERIAKEGDQHG